MDGSASAWRNEASRATVSRAFSTRTGTEASAQNGVFEQLLALSFTAQRPIEKQPEAAEPEASIAAKPPNNTVCDEDDTICDEDDEVIADDDDHFHEPTSAVGAQTSQMLPSLVEKPTQLKFETLANDETGQAEPTTETGSVADEANVQPTSNLCDLPQRDEDPVQTQVPLTILESPATAVTDTAQSVTSLTQVAAEAIPRNEMLGSVISPSLVELSRPRDFAADQATEHAEPVVQLPVEISKATLQPAEPIAPATATSATSEYASNQANSPLNQDAVASVIALQIPSDAEEDKPEAGEKWFEQGPEVTGSMEIAATNETRETDALLADQNTAASRSTETTAAVASSPENIVPPVADASSGVAGSTLSAWPVSTQLNAQALNSTTASSAGKTSAESTNFSAATPTRLTGSQTAKAVNTDSNAAPALSQQERMRVIQRIARSFNRISAGGGQINLRLHPAQLGSVSVQIRLDGRSMSARLVTETAAARDAIMQDLPALRQRLADQGFDVTKFQVEVAGNGADATFSQSGGQSNSEHSDNRSSGAAVDYRRMASSREARAATAPAPVNVAKLNWPSGVGLDLQA